jgi:hypothetical protein
MTRLSPPCVADDVTRPASSQPQLGRGHAGTVSASEREATGNMEPGSPRPGWPVAGA